MCVKWRCTYNLHKTKHPPGRAPADDAWSQSQVLMHMHDVTHAFFLLLQGKHVVLTHKCCNWGARSLNQTRSITQEWRDLLTEISLYAVMIYTGEWFIELFTLGTVVRECVCVCVCVRVLDHACPEYPIPNKQTVPWFFTNPQHVHACPRGSDAPESARRNATVSSSQQIHASCSIALCAGLLWQHVVCK